MMADSEKLSTALSESVLTLLCFDDDKGNIISGFVKPEHFEHPLNDIAERALTFRAKFHKAPGEAHIDDLFDHVLSDPHNRLGKIYRRILTGMLAQSRDINADYVVDRITEFVRQQTLKAAVIRAGERYQQGGEGVADDVERIMLEATKVHVQTFDRGISLADTSRALSFLDINTDENSCPTGIRELDRTGFMPTRGQVLLYIGPKGSGKTWFCTNCGKNALMQRWKTAHISLEMKDNLIAGRYIQSLFAVAKRDEEFLRTSIDIDELGRICGLDPRTQIPRLDFRDPRIRNYLSKRMGEWGIRLDRIRIKHFPSGTLTLSGLNSYLDMLDTTEHFQPDLLIVDYPKLMQRPAREDETAWLDRLMVDLRGVAEQRNCALVTPQQTGREGGQAKTVYDTHAGGAWATTHHADMVVTYSQTSFEHHLGLARLFVSKNRGDKDHYTVLISQSYDTGQYAVESAMFNSEYWKILRKQDKSTSDRDSEDE